VFDKKAPLETKEGKIAKRRKKNHFAHFSPFCFPIGEFSPYFRPFSLLGGQRGGCLGDTDDATKQ
jgi:hypothetical protein